MENESKLQQARVAELEAALHIESLKPCPDCGTVCDCDLDAALSHPWYAKGFDSADAIARQHIVAMLEGKATKDV